MKGADLAMEVTVISAEDLNGASSVFGFRLRPFVAAADAVDCNLLPTPLHRTRLADGSNPSWGDLLRIPLDPSFLVSTRGDDDDAGICLVVLSKRPLGGAARLGWCRIPPADVLDGLRHPSEIRRLSYALRHPRHGGRGRGAVHVAVRLVGRDVNRLLRQQPAPELPPQHPEWGGVAIGIPVAALGPPPSWPGGGVEVEAGSGGQNAEFAEGRAGLVLGFEFCLKFQPHMNVRGKLPTSLIRIHGTELNQPPITHPWDPPVVS